MGGIALMSRVTWAQARGLLEAGATVVTATRRLTRFLDAEYAAWQQGRGRHSWLSPDILPFEPWLVRLWEAGSIASGDPEACLGEAQERAVWERVIAASPEADGLLQVSATARAAAEAWHLLGQWGLSLAAVRSHGGREAEVFCAWGEAFLTVCRDHRWRDRSRLGWALRERFAALGRGLPSRVIWAGFDELTPVQRALGAALDDLGIGVVELAVPDPGGEAVAIALPDAQAEIEAAARWARARLEARPTARIGIVVFDLGGLRATVERIFDAILHPGGLSPGRLFNLSLGGSLDHEPVIATALTVLDLAAGRLPTHVLGDLLRTPFIAGGDREIWARAELDRRLRSLGEPELGLTGEASVLDWAAVDWSACPALRASLARLRRLCEGSAARQGPAAWVRRVSDWLAALGWPGERPLDSREYQAVEQWRGLLSAYAALEQQLGPEDLAGAREHIRRLAAETLFQPESAETPIQILGLLEAGGLAFDHLWLAGLSDAAWPPSPRPDPFIPRSLQRQHGMPHATAERELGFARRVTGRLLRAAPEVVCSFPLREADSERQISPLLAPLARVGLGDLPQSPVPHYADLIQHSGQWERFDDPAGPALPSEGAGRRPTSLFRDQAACPFRAFARHRLEVARLEQPRPGLSPAERGTLVHGALERVWGELGDHATLLRQSAGARRALAERAAEGALVACRRRRPLTLSGRLAALERERLVALIEEWLAVEIARPPFEVVAREAALADRIGGLSLRGRVDRIDRLPDGSLALIDYKTGQASPNAWSSARPDAPQLPLYAVARGKEVGAVAFARLRRGDMGFAGLARSSDLLPGVTDPHRSPYTDLDWSDQLTEWRAVLEALAHQFLAGDARVDPKHGRRTCQECDLAPLCRVFEAVTRD
jgi:probable DNA repair protein